MIKADLLIVETKIKILRPREEVFSAIVDPAKMSRYFISQSSGRMEEGKTLSWRFPEFEMEFPVYIGKIVKDTFISYSWEIDNKRLVVEMTLEAAGDQSTIVSIVEKNMNNDETGIKWLKQNTEGWANFLCCLKAWLEYGINLRKGAFDFLKDKN